MIVNNHKQEIILASNSIRRAQLLDQIGISYTVIASDFDESKIKIEDPVELVQTLALLKAESIECSENESRVILAADTVVVLDKLILGKPSNEIDAIRYLKLLSGRTHEVYTGVCLYRRSDQKKVVFFQRTEVTMSDLDELDIAYYISTKEPFDKAGAYGIQGIGARFIQGIKGDFYTVVGLPLNTVIKELKEFF